MLFYITFLYHISWSSQKCIHGWWWHRVENGCSWKRVTMEMMEDSGRSDPLIVCPTEAELQAEPTVNVPCTVDGCSKIFNTSAARSIHIIQTHKIYKVWETCSIKRLLELKRFNLFQGNKSRCKLQHYLIRFCDCNLCGESFLKFNFKLKWDPFAVWNSQETWTLTDFCSSFLCSQKKKKWFYIFLYLSEIYMNERNV